MELIALGVILVGLGVAVGILSDVFDDVQKGPWTSGPPGNPRPHREDDDYGESGMS